MIEPQPQTMGTTAAPATPLRFVELLRQAQEAAREELGLKLEIDADFHYGFNRNLQGPDVEQYARAITEKVALSLGRPMVAHEMNGTTWYSVKVEERTRELEVAVFFREE